MTDPYPNIRRKPRPDKDERSKMLEEIARHSAAEADKEEARKTAALAEEEARSRGTRQAAREEAFPPPKQETLPPVDQPLAKLPKIIDPWSNLYTIDVNETVLERNRIITASRHDPAHMAFDVLRARMIQAMANNGWKRVAITSPTAGCGKTFVAVNLAIALSRYENTRTILLDLDMRHPKMAAVLGATAMSSTADFLRGDVPPEIFLRRMGRNLMNIGNSLAIGLNSQAEAFAAEIVENLATGDSLNRIERELHPDVMIFDLPPALAYDDVIAFRPHFDAVLMVVAGDRTKAKEVRESMRRLGDDCPLLGVILNRSEDGAGDLQWI